jgi:hypothetical protein
MSSECRISEVSCDKNKNSKEDLGTLESMLDTIDKLSLIFLKTENELKRAENQLKSENLEK